MEISASVNTCAAEKRKEINPRWQDSVEFGIVEMKEEVPAFECCRVGAEFQFNIKRKISHAYIVMMIHGTLVRMCGVKV